MAWSTFVKSVVGTCLRIRKDDRVCVLTWAHMLGLAEAFMLECQRIGARTHLEVETDALYYQNMLDLPPEYVRKPNPFSLSLLDVSTANIYITGPEDPRRLREVTPERIAALVEGDKQYTDKFLERRIRTAQIYSGYVTPQRARTYGFSYKKWKKNVQAALDVDYQSMQQTGKKIAKMLEKAATVRIAAKNGTDLTLELEKTEANIYDGVIDDEDIRRGAVFAALPAGGVTVAPKASSAEGIFISDVPEADSGLMIHGVTYKFKNGRLASITGGENSEKVASRWKAAGGDKDQASWLSIGLNPKAQGGFLANNIVLGSFTIGIGDNREIGGKVESNFGSRGTILKPDIRIDMRQAVKDGKLIT